MSSYSRAEYSNSGHPTKTPQPTLAKTQRCTPPTVQLLTAHTKHVRPGPIVDPKIRASPSAVHVPNAWSPPILAQFGSASACMAAWSARLLGLDGSVYNFYTVT